LLNTTNWLYNIVAVITLTRMPLFKQQQRSHQEFVQISFSLCCIYLENRVYRRTDTSEIYVVSYLSILTFSSPKPSSLILACTRAHTRVTAILTVLIMHTISSPQYTCIICCIKSTMWTNSKNFTNDARPVFVDSTSGLCSPMCRSALYSHRRNDPENEHLIGAAVC